MAIKIGSARVSERGSIVGAKGDQTGYEVAIENFYNHNLGWTVLRAKDGAVANKLAWAMTALCNNQNFGYSQPERLTGYNAAAVVGFDPSKVKVKCNIDCSEAVRVCLAYAGIKVGDFITSNEVSVVMATKKFDKITSVSAGMLKNGDILVTKKKGHTAIVVSGAQNPTQSTTVTKPTTAPTTSTTSPQSANIKATESARSFNKAFSKTMTTKAAANIRNGAGIDKTKLGVLPQGTKVRCYGYYTPVGSTKWFYVTASANGKNYTGFVSGAMLR